MTQGTPRQRSAGFLISLSIVAALLVTGFASLGMWQVHRLTWKRALIARVESRVHAAPVAAPRAVDGKSAYLRVVASGRFLNSRATLVQASTVKGAGYWVMTPLATDRGFTVIINRGFVPPEAKASYGRPEGKVQITGLVRLSEPRGGFLRANDPSADRWYSRDVAAIARARRLDGGLADYFIDAEQSGPPAALPVGGLTVLSFPNNHLSYALTWFALAAMVAGAYMMLMRYEWKERRL